VSGAVVLIILANVIGGATYLAQKCALDGLPPATVTLLRNLIAMACMVLWLAPKGGLTWRYDRAELRRLALVGVVGYAAPLLLGIWGLRGSTAGNGSILILLEPASILVFSWLLLRERIRVIQVLGILAGLAGALCIVLEQAPIGDLFTGAHLRGNLVLAAHGILWGLYSPLMLPLARRHRATDVTFAAMVFSMLLLVPATLAEIPQWHGGPTLGPALLWTLALGVIASFGGTVLWVTALQHLNASTVAPFVFLQPLSGVLAGHLVLGEVLTREALLGGLLIGAGVLLVIAPSMRRRSATAAPTRATAD